MSGIFLTGATGFVGGHVLPRLAAGGRPVHCLARDPSKLPEVEGDVHAVPGDLLGPEAWRGALAQCDTVVHLAALTGKAREEEHFRVNAAAVVDLIAAAKEAGVRRFLFVSTIAAAYPEKRFYPYARAKEEAEACVRASGLDWVVLRPTVILGGDSPLWESFRALAAAPVLPLFGGGRRGIQPVHVDDVAACIAALARGDELGGRTLEFGGRDRITMAEFLRRARRALTGKDGPALPVPVSPVIGLLALLEKPLFDALPATAGQFYVFAHDAVAGAAPGLEPPLEERRGVDEIIAGHVASGAAANAAAASAGVLPSDAVLDAECDAFCRYLTGRDPSEYVRGKYRQAHHADPARLGGDDPLPSVARRGPRQARLVDAWSAFLARDGAFRRKTVLLLAILESTGETSALVDSPDAGSRGGFFVGTALRVAGLLLSFLVALVAVPLLSRSVKGADG